MYKTTYIFIIYQPTRKVPLSKCGCYNEPHLWHFRFLWFFKMFSSLKCKNLDPMDSFSVICIIWPSIFLHFPYISHIRLINWVFNNWFNLVPKIYPEMVSNCAKIIRWTIFTMKYIIRPPHNSSFWINMSDLMEKGCLDPSGSK